MAEPTVFIPNVPTRYDTITGQLVTAVDLSPAVKYGRLAPMVEGPIQNRNMGAAISRVREMAATAGADDYVLVVGDLILVTVAMVAVAEHNGGHVRALRWDRSRRTYDVVEVELWESNQQKCNE